MLAELPTSGDAAEGYKYFMRVDPEMRDFLGPIETDYDTVTRREMRSRLSKIAMLRGSTNLVEHRVYLDPVPHIRQDKGQDLRGWYSSKGDGAIRGKRERPCMTDAILTQPYGGHCSVNCPFCYLISGHRGYRGSGLISVPLGYGEQVRRQLKGMISSQAGYFSSFNDPFLSVEDYYHNTQNGAQAFVDEGLPIFFLSRLNYHGWAFDMLQKNRHSYMQKSINTPDEDDWKKLSPGAASLEEHFAEIREARRRGIYVSIQVNPIVAGIVTHDDIERLFEKLAEAGVNHVIVKFVEANYPWASAMVEKMVKRFGANRAEIFKQLFTENSAGQQKTIQREYRIEGHARYQRKATVLGMTYATCYEYDKNADGTHRSIGKDWLTGDTCHGHRVPFYVRPTLGKPFAPLAACPPSGCLSCADTTTDKKGQCGSTLLGAAKALKIGDLRKSFDGVIAPEESGFA